MHCKSWFITHFYGSYLFELWTHTYTYSNQKVKVSQYEELNNLGLEGSSTATLCTCTCQFPIEGVSEVLFFTLF